MATMMLVGVVMVGLALIAGFRIALWSSRANGLALGQKPPPEGWAARCTTCGNPVGYSVTWAPAVRAMRKEHRDKVKFDLALHFQNPPARVTRELPAAPPPVPPPQLALVGRDEPTPTEPTPPESA